MNIRLAISTCPNDTFAFYALVYGKIPTRGYTFELVLGDIQELNDWAEQGKAEVVKVSSNAIGILHPEYYLLNSGSALGHGCGPLWICRKGEAKQAESAGRVGIPGKMTTANLLLHFRAPHLQNREQKLFSEILESVESGELTSGLLIHEQRFTYQTHAVELIEDLGEYWERMTHQPIPLGSIVASRKLPREVVQDMEEMIRESIQWAFDHPEGTQEFVCKYAAELEESVMQAHINLYVNQYSLNFGAAGVAALNELFRTGTQAGLYLPVPPVEQLMISSSFSLTT